MFFKASFLNPTLDAEHPLLFASSRLLLCLCELVAVDSFCSIFPDICLQLLLCWFSYAGTCRDLKTFSMKAN